MLEAIIVMDKRTCLSWTYIWEPLRPSRLLVVCNGLRLNPHQEGSQLAATITSKPTATAATARATTTSTAPLLLSLLPPWPRLLPLSLLRPLPHHYVPKPLPLLLLLLLLLPLLQPFSLPKRIPLLLDHYKLLYHYRTRFSWLVVAWSALAWFGALVFGLLVLACRNKSKQQANQNATKAGRRQWKKRNISTYAAFSK